MHLDEVLNLIEDKNMQKHYNNKNGSLYKIGDQRKWNSWEQDIIKRVDRCRKKGEFESDIKKTIFLLELYLKEYTEKDKDPNQTNILEQIETLNTPQGSIKD